MNPIVTNERTLAALKRLLDKEKFGTEESFALSHAMAVFQTRIETHKPIVLPMPKVELDAELVPLEPVHFERRIAPVTKQELDAVRLAA